MIVKGGQGKNSSHNKAYILIRFQLIPDNKIIKKIKKVRGIRYFSQVCGAWEAVAEIKFKNLKNLDKRLTKIKSKKEVSTYLENTVVYLGLGKHQFENKKTKNYKGYLLAKIGPGKEEEIINNLKKRADIIYATQIHGPWDLLVEMQYNKLNEFNRTCRIFEDDPLSKKYIKDKTTLMEIHYT